jgi:cellulose synthase/poly-beta-1,6-N-acetylglucosamine synthase-like glycosyltransferase
MTAQLIWAAVFWLSCGLLVCVYVLYPVIMKAIAARAGVPVHRSEGPARISVVVTAYNEEKGLGEKLDNILASALPTRLEEIIVASDASTDRTDDIVRSYAASGVRLLRVEGRQGKTACQNAAAAAATGDILVFTDATTQLHTDALRNLSAWFADPDVGCVGGRLVYQSASRNATGQGNEAYWDYEIKLRLAESALGSLIGVSGCLYGVRRSAYRPIDPRLISDFVVSMRMREQSLRTVLAPDALCFEETLSHSTHELPMRVRVAVRSINALFCERKFLNPVRFGVFAWQLWFHKVLRYASPFLWLLALAANTVLAAHQRPYAFLLAGQLAVLVLGAAGFAAQSRHSRLGVLWRPYYFLLTNLASLIAALRYLRGDRMVTWKPLR